MIIPAVTRSVGMKSIGASLEGIVMCPFMMRYVCGADVLIPSFHPLNGNSSVVSQHPGRTMVHGSPEAAMTCSPMLFVYV